MAYRSGENLDLFASEPVAYDRTKVEASRRRAALIDACFDGATVRIPEGMSMRGDPNFSAMVVALRKMGFGPMMISRRLKVSRTAIYNLMQEKRSPLPLGKRQPRFYSGLKIWVLWYVVCVLTPDAGPLTSGLARLR